MLRWAQERRGPPPKSKGGPEARRFEKSHQPGSPGGAKAPPGLEGYFFFAFLAFLAFFAFFAFLAIASSFGLMGGNATRGMLGGGPASQYPQIQSHQIRSALLHTAMPLSSRYPQLLRAFTGFSPVVMRRAPQNRLTRPELRRSSGVRVNEVRRRRRFCTDPEQANAARRPLHQFNTTVSNVARR